MNGDFEINGREFHFEIISVENDQGDLYEGGDIEANTFSVDRIVYTINSGLETFYRTVYGPFESVSDMEAAIIDEAGEYEEAV